MDTGVVIQPPAVLELPVGEVQTDGSPALRAHPPGALACPGPDFKDVLAHDRPQHLKVRLGLAFRTPHESCVAEEVAVRGLVFIGVAVPVGPVGPSGL